jgi:2-methylcitrate dehydratase PrpD
MKKKYAERYAEFVESLKFEDIPIEVVEHAKKLFLDTIGICVASTKRNHSQIFPELILDMGGKQESTVVGKMIKVPAPNAALVNGTLAHYLDYDDSHLKSEGHVSATIVPTAMAVGESLEISGKELITAAVAGWECITRIGMTFPLNFHNKGFHCTGIIGPFGASVTAGKLKKMNADTLASALGICGSQAAALMECRNDGSMVKRMHPGWSAHAGIIASRLAAKGFTGPHSVFEGKFGLYISHLGPGNYDPSILSTLGKEWETLNCLIKPYPCAHYLHAYIDAAIKLKKTYGIEPDDIEHIEVFINERGAKLTCESSIVQSPPASAYSAQFSLRYAVALALTQEGVTLKDFRNEKIIDTQLTSIGKKISHTIHPEMAHMGEEGYFSGWIKIKKKNGKIHEYVQKYNLGSRENPLNTKEVINKFNDNTIDVLPADTIQKIAEIVDKLEKVENVSKLMEQLRF